MRWRLALRPGIASSRSAVLTIPARIEVLVAGQKATPDPEAFAEALKRPLKRMHASAGPAGSGICHGRAKGCGRCKSPCYAPPRCDDGGQGDLAGSFSGALSAGRHRRRPGSSLRLALGRRPHRASLGLGLRARPLHQPSRLTLRARGGGAGTNGGGLGFQSSSMPGSRSNRRQPSRAVTGHFGPSGRPQLAMLVCWSTDSICLQCQQGVRGRLAGVRYIAVWWQADGSGDAPGLLEWTQKRAWSR